MPTNLPSSFASAAAGQNANRGGRGGPGSDWSRRDGRSANGTLTLRRTSTTPLSQTPQPPASADNAVQLPGLEQSPVAQQTTYELSPARYSKEELLAMSQFPRSRENVSRLFSNGWDPDQVNAGGSRAWGKSNENHVPQEPGACWDEHGDSVPLGLQPLTAEEKEAFSNDINSPLKPPTMNKDTTNTGGVNGRKASTSQGSGNAFGVNSPSSASRPGTRRRETTDSATLGLNSPTAAARTGREDNPLWFSRKGGDLKEDSTAEDTEADPAAKDASSRLPFGGLMRSNTSGNAGMGSIWSASNPGTPGGGAFGHFAMGAGSATPAASGGEKKQPGVVGAVGSRLAHLIPKDNTEGSPSRQGGDGQYPQSQSSWRSRQRTGTDPFGEDTPSGSAALGGAQDTSADAPQSNRVGTLGTPVKGSAGDFGMSGLSLGGQGEEAANSSPSGTNPFRSPPAERPDNHENGETGAHPNYSAFGGQDPSASFNPLQRALSGAPDANDRSQTSSAGTRGPPLGHMSAWAAPGAGLTSGTPDRDRGNFPGGPFSPAVLNNMGEAPSPGGLGNLGGLFGPPSASGMGAGSIGRGSRLHSLFPAAMQAQMQQSHEQQQQHEGLGDPSADMRQVNPLGAIGRNNLSMPLRDTESPLRSTRGIFEDMFPSSDATRSQGVFGAAESGQPGSAVTAPQSFTPVSGSMPFGGGSGAPLEPPSAQSRTMVMPDRMRWVYLDPQGQVQGPFTGLEMNDWYKAQFFSPDLRVKKVEDTDFEPLGQLIRRIGNSREPFLVPQVGIPHGPPSQTSAFPGTNPGAVVPPLSGVFPHFGRTLSAEEQNNLERRKQEEQYMLAQQREFVMRQQAIGRFPGSQPGLQHHSSAHSLQSQPSFGSMTSPIQGQMPQPPIGGLPGGLAGSGGQAGSFFDPAGEGRGTQGANAGSGHDVPLGDAELGPFTQDEHEMLAGMHGGGGDGLMESGFGTGVPDLNQMPTDPEVYKERLMEFQQLRAEREAEQVAQANEAARAAEYETSANDIDTRDYAQQQQEHHQQQQQQQQQQQADASSRRSKNKDSEEDNLSLTQQVQQAQAAAAMAQTTESDMPMPFPPLSSSTPLPAPTAQRARSNLPEVYNRSRSGSPVEDQSAPVQPPPLAPWAKEPGNDAHKGPSLKEIQEAEARQAAQAEQQAAAMRKAALDQEVALLREKEKQATTGTVGLPATSTWGTSSPVSSGSPWSKPSAAKAPAPGLGRGTSSSSKKTLAEIQEEEERRKQKAREATAQTGAPPSASKSYANLAGKPGQPMIPSSSASPAAGAPPSGAGWATVGAGGKVKIPTGPSAQTRTVSATTVKPTAASPIKPMSRPGPAAASNGNVASGAMDEFRKWVHRELSRGLNSVDHVPNFVTTLEALPLDTGIIADAIYASSDIMDGRHFAEEYVRRKKLAEKGVAEKQPTPSAEPKSSSSGGGWSEVAKKTSAPVNPAPKEDNVQAAGFKVVPSRKKGKK